MQTSLAAALLALAAALGAAPAPAQTPTRDVALLKTAGEADAAIFVLERYFTGDNDIEAISRLYGDTVWYFDLGPQPKSAIMADKRAYIDRWPERAFTPDLSTLSVSRLGGEVYDISVEVDFTVKNGPRQVAGRTLIELTVERGPDGVSFRITEEGGRVLSRPSNPGN